LVRALALLLLPTETEEAPRFFQILSRDDDEETTEPEPEPEPEEEADIGQFATK
jgi:hypothetical protein